MMRRGQREALTSPQSSVITRALDQPPVGHRVMKRTCDTQRTAIAQSAMFGCICMED